MKKLFALLLTITAPLWMFPAFLFGVLFTGGHALYKKLLKDMEKNSE